LIKSSNSTFPLVIFSPRWQIDKSVKAPEGIAYRIDEHGHQQLLISSYDQLINDSLIYVFNVPTFSSSEVAWEDDFLTLHPAYHLNEKVMSDGIIGNKKIAAIQVFEGLLYVLYDNARVIRSFDLATGDFVNELKLPRVGISNGAFDKQFEGLFLERVDNADTSSEDASKDSTDRRLRGFNRTLDEDGKGQIKLHLALDSPPEIWTFVLQEGQDAKQYSFPKCAAAI
jgi:hypothetical protein